MEITVKGLTKLIKEVEQKAINMSSGYVGLTKDLEIWTYSSEPNPNRNLCGCSAITTNKEDKEWQAIVLYNIIEKIKLGEIEGIKLIK